MIQFFVSILLVKTCQFIFKMYKISDGFNVKKHQCVECKQNFKSAIGLKRHKDTGHKTFQFQYQTFGPPSASEKPYSCVWCPTKFAFTEQINLHTRLVHGFNCNPCMKEISTWKEFYAHAEECKLAKSNIEYHKKKQLLFPKKH